MNVSIEDIMWAWQDVALEFWDRNILDDQNINGRFTPGNRRDITRMFERTGWLGFIGGHYVEGSNNPWCGHFQANCGLLLGKHLGPKYTASEAPGVPVAIDYDIARFVLPSTRRIYPRSRQGRKTWLKAGYTSDPSDDYPSPAGCYETHGETGDGIVDELVDMLAIPRVATVTARDYGDSRNQVGGHFVLITSFDPDAETFTTVEGNGWGYVKSGDWREGVVRRYQDRPRDLSELRCVYLFDDSHFERMDRP